MTMSETKGVTTTGSGSGSDSGSGEGTLGGL